MEFSNVRIFVSVEYRIFWALETNEAESHGFEFGNGGAGSLETGLGGDAIYTGDLVLDHRRVAFGIGCYLLHTCWSRPLLDFTPRYL